MPDSRFSFFGYDVDTTSRFSFGLVSTEGDSFDATSGQFSSRGTFFSYTMKASDNVKFSVTSSMLDEKNMALGSQSTGYLSLASEASSTSYGFGSEIKFADGYSLGFDAAYATTETQDSSKSLISDVSTLQSYSFSVALAKKDMAVKGDKLGVQISKPLRVYSGSANVTMTTGVDGSGNPVTETRRVSLVPDGNETDINFSYNRPLGEDITGSLSLTARDDADNIRGARDVAGMFKVKFSY